MKKATFSSEEPSKLREYRKRAGQALKGKSKSPRLRKNGAFDLTREKFKI